MASRYNFDADPTDSLDADDLSRQLESLSLENRSLSSDNAELRAHIAALTNSVRLARQPQPPSYRDSSFPATASLETAVFSSGSAARGRSSNSSRTRDEPTSLRSTSSTASRSTISTTRGSGIRTAPNTPTRHCHRERVAAEHQERVVVNVYGPSLRIVQPTTPAATQGRPTAPPVVQAPGNPAVPAPIAPGPPPPVPVWSSGVALHLRTPLRYKMPIPLERPPRASDYKGRWYYVTTGYGTGVFKEYAIALLLTEGLGEFKHCFKSAETWEQARDSYESLYRLNCVRLRPCPDDMYEAAIGDPE